MFNFSLRYHIKISALEGIDNVKIEYLNGSISYGSYTIKDPNDPDITIDLNAIKPGECFLISTDINEYGIYIIDINGKKTEITDKCKIENDFPVFYSGVTSLTIEGLGIIEFNSNFKKETIDNFVFGVLVETNRRYIPLTNIEDIVEVKPWEMYSYNPSTPSISIYDNATGMTIFIFDTSLSKHYKIEECIGKVVIKDLPKRTNAVDPTDGRNSLKLFSFKDINGNQTHPALLGREYYNNGNYGDYTLFTNFTEELNPLYSGEMKVKTTLIDLLYEHKNNTDAFIYQTKNVYSENGKAYDYQDITEKLEIEITYPNYHDGL